MPEGNRIFVIENRTVTLLCVCGLIYFFSTALVVDEKSGSLCSEFQKIARRLMICLHRYRLEVIATVSG